MSRWPTCLPALLLPLSFQEQSRGSAIAATMRRRPSRIFSMQPEPLRGATPCLCATTRAESRRTAEPSVLKRHDAFLKIRPLAAALILLPTAFRPNSSHSAASPMPPSTANRGHRSCERISWPSSRDTLRHRARWFPDHSPTSGKCERIDLFPSVRYESDGARKAAKSLRCGPDQRTGSAFHRRVTRTCDAWCPNPDAR